MRNDDISALLIPSYEVDFGCVYVPVFKIVIELEKKIKDFQLITRKDMPLIFTSRSFWVLSKRQFAVWYVLKVISCL